MHKIRTLRFRQREPKDDRFIIDLTLAVMGNVFEQSVGAPLTEDTIRQHLKSDETILIIERGGKPVGYTSYKIYKPGRMYWSSLILSPDHQSRGLGRQVVRHVEKVALANGVRRIEGHVQTDNRRAISFWLKNGFSITGMPVQGTLAIEKRLPPNRSG
ncbi:GNAT family N-acetyltransferase [Effusibacillus pohliae]|uniref:GNAT family N-acetyltransferase n=1 Tax=Effusibacillus pohliae TaxID=232270 RepID=UPI0003793B1C|nr:GNAT family N-acetyltransferase [Effusibacillus pohliae]